MIPSFRYPIDGPQRAREPTRFHPYKEFMYFALIGLSFLILPNPRACALGYAHAAPLALECQLCVWSTIPYEKSNRALALPTLLFPFIPSLPHENKDPYKTRGAQLPVPRAPRRKGSKGKIA